MINVPNLPSSQINRQIDEIRHRLVPLTYRRFSPAFKQPDVTALLQSILLAQVGETANIPSIISSTTNSAFSQSVNQLKQVPTILNHNSLTRAVVPTADSPTIVPTGVTMTGQPTLTPTSVKTPTLAKTIEDTSSPTVVNQFPSVSDQIQQANQFNVKNALNIGHIRQQTMIPTKIHVSQKEGNILDLQSKSRNVGDMVVGLQDQLTTGDLDEAHKNQLRANIINQEGKQTFINTRINELENEVKLLNSQALPQSTVGKIEKQKRGSRGGSKKKKSSSKV